MKRRYFRFSDVRGSWIGREIARRVVLRSRRKWNQFDIVMHSY